MTSAGDGRLGTGPAEMFAGPSLTPAVVDGTVYGEILAVLRSGGWVQGREHHRTRLSITAAVDRAVGSNAGPGLDGASLARRARLRNHLSRLASTANLTAWNDAPERTFADIVTLLAMAAVAFPDD